MNKNRFFKREYNTEAFGVVVTDVKEMLVSEHKRKGYFKKSALLWQVLVIVNVKNVHF